MAVNWWLTPSESKTGTGVEKLVTTDDFSLSRLLLPEAVADSYRNDRKETGIAEVMVVPRFEGGEVLLEARVLIDRLAAH